MISVGYLFEVMPDTIETAPNYVPGTTISPLGAQMKTYQDRSVGEKFYDKLHHQHKITTSGKVPVTTPLPISSPAVVVK